MCLWSFFKWKWIGRYLQVIFCQMTCTVTSSTETPTGETLTTLSDAFMQKMDLTQLSNYLMDAAQFLKTDDLQGWKTKFTPLPVTPLPVTKKLRQSPRTAAVVPEKACAGCHSLEVIDDVKNGQIVCTSCGLIQSLVAFKGDTAHCSYNRMKSLSAVYIHRYSRVVNFLTIIRFMAGDSHPVVDADTKCLLRAELDGKKVNSYEVRKALCRLGLSRRYRRHTMSFVREWNEKRFSDIPGQLIMTMVKMFRVIEFHFDKKKYRLWPNRKTFFSYKFILYQLLNQLDRPDLTGPHHLLKSKKLLHVQLDVYNNLCEYTGLTCFYPEYD